MNTILDSRESELVKTLVNLEDLYGMNWLEPVARPETTLPNADRLALMCFASSNLTPVEVVLRTRSLPAKSASTNRP